MWPLHGQISRNIPSISVNISYRVVRSQRGFAHHAAGTVPDRPHWEAAAVGARLTHSGAEAEEQGENHPMKLVCKVSACRVSAGVIVAETLQVCIIQKSAAADSDSKVDSGD